MGVCEMLLLMAMIDFNSSDNRPPFIDNLVYMSHLKSGYQD